MSHRNLDDSITKRFNTEGLNIENLEPGTTLLAETQNSYYQIKIVDKREITVQGGMRKSGNIRFEGPTPAFLFGSTWGGSMIKLGWIGKGMLMEICFEDDKKKLVTTPVQNLEVTAPDESWSYSMDWNEECEH